MTDNFDKFCSVYRKYLKEFAEKGEYLWPIDELEDVALRMIAAFSRHSFNKNGKAIKATCKELNIKHTYKAIQEYWWNSNEK
jgi:hypothetical protein